MYIFKYIKAYKQIVLVIAACDIRRKEQVGTIFT